MPEITGKFEVTALFKFEKDFLHRFHTNIDEAHDRGRIAMRKLNESVTTSVTTEAENVRRTSDEHTIAVIKEAMQSSQGLNTPIKEISIILHTAETAHKICLSGGDPRICSTE